MDGLHVFEIVNDWGFFPAPLLTLLTSLCISITSQYLETIEKTSPVSSYSLSSFSLCPSPSPLPLLPSLLSLCVIRSIGCTLVLIVLSFRPFTKGNSLEEVPQSGEGKEVDKIPCRTSTHGTPFTSPTT